MSKENDKNRKEKETEKNIQKMFEESFPKFIHFNNKALGKGGFNIIHSMTLSRSIMGAGKIIKINENNAKKDEIYYSTVLKGRNIIKKHAGLEVNYNTDKYHLIVMEKAIFSDLNKLNYHIKNRNLFMDIKLIFKTIGVLFGDDNAS